jgi:uncharacterized protein
MSRLPVSLDPFLPRAVNQRWEGELGATELTRLCASAPAAAPVSARVALTIVRGQLGEIRLQGTIEGEVGQECQRCLQPMIWSFRLDPDVILVDPAGAPAALGDDQDVLELGPDGLLQLADFVEEEILLALPLAPRHEHCAARLPHEFGAGGGDRTADNPFAVLQELRKKP